MKAPSANKKAEQYSELPLRIASAAVLAAFALYCTWAGGQTFFFLCAVAALLIFFEYRGMVKSVLPNRIALFALALLALLLASYFVERADSGAMVVALGALLLALWEFAIRRSAWGAVGLLYSAIPFMALVALREGEFGLFMILFIFACVWGADTFAYFAGKTFGGPKLAPAISPNKTWSGFLGGLIGAVIVSLVLEIAFGYEVNIGAIMLAVLLSLFSQSGDLFESWVKRRFGLKDSGKIIPGHGGILDRIDGLIFAVSGAFFISLLIARTGLGDKLLPLSLIETFFVSPV